MECRPGQIREMETTRTSRRGEPLSRVVRWSDKREIREVPERLPGGPARFDDGIGERGHGALLVVAAENARGVEEE
jgi:hypothetical protein